MDDLISRQDAIEINRSYHGQMPNEVNHRIWKEINELPSAQPDVPDIIVGDMISRQAATTMPVMPKEHRHYQTNNLDDAYEQGWNDLQECIEKLPPVQPNHNAEVSKKEIVCCENCEHWDTSWETVYGLHYCPMIDMATKKNFFCKYGAEKKGEA